MKIICITGSTSGVGKTTLIEKLLPLLPGPWGVCKVTVCREGPHACPRGKEDTCGVCSSLEEDYLIESREDVILTEGKDTWRYVQAGAKKVLWLKSKAEFLHASVGNALKSFEGLSGVLLEGNNALQTVEPDLAVMVEGKPLRYKSSARKILDRIDIRGEASDPSMHRRILDFLTVTL